MCCFPSICTMIPAISKVPRYFWSKSPCTLTVRRVGSVRCDSTYSNQSITGQRCADTWICWGRAEYHVSILGSRPIGSSGSNNISGNTIRCPCFLIQLTGMSSKRYHGISKNTTSSTPHDSYARSRIWPSTRARHVKHLSTSGYGRAQVY